MPFGSFKNDFWCGAVMNLTSENAEKVKHHLRKRVLILTTITMTDTKLENKIQLYLSKLEENVMIFGRT